MKNLVTSVLSVVANGLSAVNSPSSPPSHAPSQLPAAVTPANSHQWIPAGEGDLRGPCPLMNTLANHGYIPRDGRNITREAAVSGLDAAVNFNETLAEILWARGATTNPETNAKSFTLQQLRKHGLLEHDGSMSRNDNYFSHRGWEFNQTVFDSTRKHWTAPTVTPKMLADGRRFRLKESKATNPEFVHTHEESEASLGEAAAPILLLGDLDAGVVNRDWIEYWIQNERFPESLGWKRRQKTAKVEDAIRLSDLVRAESDPYMPSRPRSIGKMRRRTRVGHFE